MSTIAGPRPVSGAVGGQSPAAGLKAYFFSDSRRSIQTVLALIWLLVEGVMYYFHVGPWLRAH